MRRSTLVLHITMRAIQLLLCVLPCFGSGISQSTSPSRVDKKPALAIVLLIDRSGSMGAALAGGRTRMSYAKTSALRTAQALGQGDLVLEPA
ncbi:MAG: hypothetical protein WAT39_04305 [Planctomycetota bacterium]